MAAVVFETDVLSQSKRGQAANPARIQGADFEEAGAATAGGESGAGYLGEDREFHQRRVVPLKASVWQGWISGKSWNAEMLKRVREEGPGRAASPQAA